MLQEYIWPLTVLILGMSALGLWVLIKGNYDKTLGGLLELQVWGFGWFGIGVAIIFMALFGFGWLIASLIGLIAFELGLIGQLQLKKKRLKKKY